MQQFFLSILNAETYSPRARRIARALGVSDWYCSHDAGLRVWLPRLTVGRAGVRVDVGRFDFSVDFAR